MKSNPNHNLTMDNIELTEDRVDQIIRKMGRRDRHRRRLARALAALWPQTSNERSH